MGQPPSPPPENPIIDLIGGSDPWVIVSFAVLATTYALQRGTAAAWPGSSRRAS